MSTETEPTFPEAVARLVRKPDVYLWIVDSCPLCGYKHVHGGGSLDGDPFRKLSHRHAHCMIRPLPEPGGYILVAAPEQKDA